MRLTLFYSAVYVMVGLARLLVVSLVAPNSATETALVSSSPLRTLGLSSELAFAWLWLALFSAVCIGTVYWSERHPRVVGMWLREKPWRSVAIGFPYLFLLFQVVAIALELVAITALGQWLAPHEGYIRANSFLLGALLFTLVTMLLGPKMLSWLSRRYA